LLDEGPSGESLQRGRSACPRHRGYPRRPGRRRRALKPSLPPDRAPLPSVCSRPSGRSGRPDAVGVERTCHRRANRQADGPGRKPVRHQAEVERLDQAPPGSGSQSRKRRSWR
jgi:hypothetical protein